MNRALIHKERRNGVRESVIDLLDPRKINWVAIS
jgi:hypothetical protein